jgi:hypothetical protein
MNSVCRLLTRRYLFRGAAALLIAVITAPVQGLAQSNNRQIGLGEARSNKHRTPSGVE